MSRIPLGNVNEQSEALRQSLSSESDTTPLPQEWTQAAVS